MAVPSSLHGLRIVHCFRSPVGGLFRHVCDLAQAQAEAGALVGIICDKTEGDALSEARLQRLESRSALGLYRVPMNRLPGPGDFRVLSSIGEIVAGLKPHVLHGHGAKGGAYVRLLPRHVSAKRFYTPHGGALHYGRLSPAGFVFHSLERALQRRTDGLIFESEYGLCTYQAQAGRCRARHTIVHNGLGSAEFDPVAPLPEAADFVYLGEMRTLKGIETLLDALAALNIERRVTLALVGAGPDLERFKKLAGERHLDEVTSWHKPMAARDAFALGRCLVMPSYKESFPYVALEAAAASVPMIATRVGGLPEIFGANAGELVPAGDARALAQAMQTALEQPEKTAATARALRAHVEQNFTVEAMAAGVARMYRAALEGASEKKEPAGAVSVTPGVQG